MNRCYSKLSLFTLHLAMNSPHVTVAFDCLHSYCSLSLQNCSLTKVVVVALCLLKIETYIGA